MLPSFQHYFGIKVKIRKNRISHRFFDFSPWSRNNYVMILTTWQLPVNFTPKNCTSKLNFEKKKLSNPGRGLRFGLKIAKTTILVWRTEFFFFCGKTVDHSLFWREFYRRLPLCCNYSNIIPGSHSKFEKTGFFIVFPTFDRDHEIVM